MDLQKIRAMAKKAQPTYDTVVDKMINDLKFFTTLFKDSEFFDRLQRYSDEEIAAGLAVLAQTANEGAVDYRIAQKHFNVDENKISEAFKYLNSVLDVSYPDKRYTLDYDSIDTDETFLFSRFLTPGQKFWQDFVDYVMEKKITDNPSDLLFEKRGRELLGDYIKLKKYPSWVKIEMRRWKKEKVESFFIVNEVEEGIVELFDIPALRSSYWVVTSDVWERLKPGAQIEALILPWKSHYFFGSEVKVLSYKHYEFIIPPELRIKDFNKETIPLLFSSQVFADVVSTGSTPVYRYLLSSILPTVVAIQPIENAEDLLWIMQVMDNQDIKGTMNFFDEVGNYLYELFSDTIYDETLLEQGIEISLFAFIMYVLFLFFSTDIFGVNLVSFIFDVRIISYNKDDYTYYINKINEKYKDDERDIAVMLLDVLALAYSNGDVLERENWKKAYKSITKEKLSKIVERIELFREEINKIIENFEDEDEQMSES